MYEENLNMEYDATQLIEQKLFTGPVYLLKNQLLQLLTLQATYITPKQCEVYNISTAASARVSLSRLEREGFIKSINYIRGMNSKAYYLTHAGYENLFIRIPNEYLKKGDLTYEEQTKNNGRIAHKVSVNDIYFALLTHPAIDDFDWFPEKDSVVTNDNGVLLFRNDARFTVHKNTYWIEQDMGTERASQLKTKATQLARHIKNNFKNPLSYPSILFTVNMELQLTNLERAKYYRDLQSQKAEVKLLQSIVKELKFCTSPTLTEYRTALEKDLNDENHHFMKKRGIQAKYDLTTALKAKKLTSLEAIVEYQSQITSKYERAKEEISSRLLSRMYTKRIELIKSALLHSDDYPSLTGLLQNGLNLYITRNDSIKSFIQKDLVGLPTYKEKIFRDFIKTYYSSDILDGGTFKYQKLGVSNIHGNALYISDMYTFINQKEAINTHVAISDIYCNLGAEVRTIELLSTISTNAPLHYICIVTDKEEANYLIEKCHLKRFKNEDGTWNGDFRYYFLIKDQDFIIDNLHS